MRKISITPCIESLVDTEYVKSIHSSVFHQKILDELHALKADFSTSKTIRINKGSKQNPNWKTSSYPNSNYVNYIDRVLSLYQSGELLKWTPSAFLSHIKTMEAMVKQDDINCPMKIGRKKRDSFASRLVKALHYDDVRKAIIPPIYRKLELKSCVYCNANYTISDADGEGYYDLDHWKPKSLYPFLAISFFNLQPSCPSCNRRKSARNDEFFGLWDDTGSNDLDVLHFKLDERSLVNYLVRLNSSDLQVNLVEADAYDPLHQKIRDNTEHRLNITARYAEHSDYTEEIVWKSKIYNPSMIQSLRESPFSALLPTQLDLERFILGTYSHPDDMHKRPLTRLATDIAKQLGLLG